MRIRGVYIVLAAAVLTAASGCQRQTDEVAPATSAPAKTSASPATFAIAGRDNSAATLATSGGDVVLTWAAKAGAGTDIYAVTSADDGATFGAPVRVNDVDGDANITGEQPPRAAIHGHDVVVIWPSHLGGSSHIRIARSADAGKTFQKAETLNPEPLTGARGWASVAFDPSGLVHALWLDGRYAGTSAMPHDHAAMAGAGEHAGMTMPMHSASKQALISATWTPGHAAKETTVADDVCFCCKTAIAAAADGALYAAYRNIYPNSIRDIAVARWAPGSDKPAAAVRVSKDEWHLEGCPDDGPALFVDAANTLHVVWPTSVDGSGGTARKGLFYAYSLDGGHTFSPRERVDEADSKTTAAHPQIAGTDGRVFVVWDQLAEVDSASKHVVFVRDITNGAAAGAKPVWTTSGEPAIVASTGSAIYPMVAFVPGAELIVWTDPQPGASLIRMSRVAR
jgi:hypothetical protein